MRKIHLIWLLFLFCFSCSDYHIEEEYENKDTTCIFSSTDEEKDIKVKTFSVLGNSISTYSGFIPSGFANYYTNSKLLLEETWWMQLSAKKEFEIASNASWSGSTVTTTNNNPESFFTSEVRLEALSVHGVPQIIIILGGTNDWGNSAGYLGDYPFDKNYDLKSFRGAYSYLVDQLKKKYPDTSIVCCSILPRKQPRTQKNTFGVTQQDIDESIAYICNMYNVIFIDMSICGLEKNIQGLTIDGLHPNKDGMKIIADYLYEKLLLLNL